MPDPDSGAAFQRNSSRRLMHGELHVSGLRDVRVDRDMPPTVSCRP
jgi:hypothetical protein